MSESHPLEIGFCGQTIRLDDSHASRVLSVTYWAPDHAIVVTTAAVFELRVFDSADGQVNVRTVLVR